MRGRRAASPGPSSLDVSVCFLGFQQHGQCCARWIVEPTSQTREPCASRYRIAAASRLNTEALPGIHAARCTRKGRRLSEIAIAQRFEILALTLNRQRKIDTGGVPPGGGDHSAGDPCRLPCRCRRRCRFFRGLRPGAWSADWAEVGCDWKYIARIERHGLKGLLFPSYRYSGGTNLVLFSANLGPADRVTPHDPNGKLPRDQRSWT